MVKNFLAVWIIILQITVMKGQDPLHIIDRNLPCVEKKFQIYAHVSLDSLRQTNISEAEIREHLEMANQAFAPICLSFELCKLDTVRDYSFDVLDDETEVGLLKSRFHVSRRINIYYAKRVLGEYTNSYSIHNGISKPDSALIVVPKSGRGVIHELGHTFGLYHTFERRFGLELVDQSNCLTAGDLICDTPADAVENPNGNCAFENKIPDANGDYYRTEIGNYMTHYFCAHCFFTSDQYRSMISNYLTSPIKMW